VILMSGYGCTYMRLADSLARFHGHEKVSVLSKPFRQADIESLLRQGDTQGNRI